MKSVLVDASSAILLYKSGIFKRLLAIYHVLIATSVHEEITRKGYPGAEVFEACVRDNNCRVLKKEDYTKKGARLQLENLSLGRGEKDTISLYLEGAGDFIIIDDGRGAGYCKKQQIPYINALLFPRILYLCRAFTEKDFKSRLKKLSVWEDIRPRSFNMPQNVRETSLRIFYQINVKHQNLYLKRRLPCQRERKLSLTPGAGMPRV
jgi:predicted nucleic acid-binding protein